MNADLKDQQRHPTILCCDCGNVTWRLSAVCDLCEEERAVKRERNGEWFE